MHPVLEKKHVLTDTIEAEQKHQCRLHKKTSMSHLNEAILYLFWAQRWQDAALEKTIIPFGD